MSEQPESRSVNRLDQAEKIANILLPLIIAIVGAFYTYTKDKSDDATRIQQTQYANFTALLPLLTSNNTATVSTALDIYIEETKEKLAPESLKGIILRIQQTQPENRAAAQAALQGTELQTSGTCRSIPSGLFIQVASSGEQLANGRVLESLLKASSGVPPVQGVQRIDQPPQQTQLRYYFNDKNTSQADQIIRALDGLGYKDIQSQDLSGRYLNIGCPPPPTFELWIGSKSPVGPDGKAHPTQ